MANILLEDLDGVSLWEELDDVSASKISGGEGIGQIVSQDGQAAARELGFKNGNEAARAFGANNFGELVSEFAQFVNGPSPTPPPV